MKLTNLQNIGTTFKKENIFLATIQKSVEDILKEIQVCAIRLEKGHHDDGILCELVDVSNNEIKGKVYADVKAFPFFMFEHYGTGQYAEMQHIGKTKHFIESGYTEWLIPVNNAPKPLPYPIVTSKYMPRVEFYLAHGVKANHFMTDAEFKTRETNKERLDEGKIIFLNFWATWCGPCKSELPEINELYHEYKDSDEVAVISIAKQRRRRRYRVHS